MMSPLFRQISAFDLTFKFYIGTFMLEKKNIIILYYKLRIYIDKLSSYIFIQQY